MAQLLSNTLYMRRFFPFYTFNICAGLDAEGKGAVYTYDAVGSYERASFACQGSGKDLIQPLLDSQLAAGNPVALPLEDIVSRVPLDAAMDIVRDAFTAAGERDIYTGDDVEVWVVSMAEGIRKERFELKRD